VEVIANINAVTTVRNNDLTSTDMSGIWLTGENFLVANNRITGGGPCVGVVLLGAPWTGLGTTVMNSVIKNNAVVGSCQFGIGGLN
jgi:hypothetical protein